MGLMGWSTQHRTVWRSTGARNDKGTVNHTRDRESFGRALGHDGPWKILQWKCFASIRCRFLAFQWKYARIQSSKKLLVMPGCSLGGCSLRGPFPGPFLTEGATDRSPRSEPIFFDFRKWGSPKKASQQGDRSGNSTKQSTKLALEILRGLSFQRRNRKDKGLQEGFSMKLCVQHHGIVPTKKRSPEEPIVIVSLCCCNYWNLNPFGNRLKMSSLPFRFMWGMAQFMMPRRIMRSFTVKSLTRRGWNIFTDDD